MWLFLRINSINNNDNDNSDNNNNNNNINNNYCQKLYNSGSWFQNKCYYYLTDVTVIWAGGRTEPPLDKPRCGWENELCLEQERQGKFLGKMCNKVVFIVYFLGCILCIFVESGTTAVRQRITLKYSFHWSRGQPSEAFSFDLSQLYILKDKQQLKIRKKIYWFAKYIFLLFVFALNSSC